MNYNPQKIEKKWQKYWEENKINFCALSNKKKPKFYNLAMFYYPSGAKIHIGHGYNYTGSDVFGRFKRLNGFNVFEPMGADAFGLPAENYALKTGVHPAKTTKDNVDFGRRQLKELGLMYDWEKEINTSSPEYYKWTQWLFAVLYRAGLAYRALAPVNWCPSCKTVLANEQVITGKCERCDSQVVQKNLKQWFFKITDYAERLLLDHKKLNWPEKTILMQKNWLGKSEGALIQFPISNFQFPIKVFTTRPDTLFGAMFMVLSPEHELIQKLKKQIKNWSEVEKYIQQSQKKTDIERTDLTKEKTGVCLKGVFAINPVNQKEIPIFIADYVLASYGTGAIMAVPAHDERDFEFAVKYNLPIVQVVKPKDISKSVILGLSVNDNKKFKEELEKHSFVFEVGLSSNRREHIRVTLKDIETDDYIKLVKKFLKDNWWVDIIGSKNVFIFKHKIIADFIGEEESLFKECKKLEPLVRKFRNIWEMFRHNIFYEDFACFVGEGIAINSGKFNGLPTEKFKTEITNWLEKNNLGKKAINYRLRDWLISRQRYWGAPIPIIECEKCGDVLVEEKDLPVKLPNLKDFKPTSSGESPLARSKNFVNVKCPQCGAPARRSTETMDTFVCSSWYFLRFISPHLKDKPFDKKLAAKWLPVDQYCGGAEHATLHLLYARFITKVLYDQGFINFDEPFKKLNHQGMILAEDGSKMSKSKGNVVIPDDYVKRYGADVFRLYVLFLAPFAEGGAWSDKGIIGIKRFLDKVWDLQSRILPELDTNKNSNANTNKNLERLVQQTIKKVTEDIENFRFNTAISALMILVNELTRQKEFPVTGYQSLVTLLSPFAPHLTEELWHRLGHKKSIFNETWPKYDPRLLKEDEIELVIQINGKVRDRILVNADISEPVAKQKALQSKKVKKWVEGKKVKKMIFVKGKLFNIVV